MWLKHPKFQSAINELISELKGRGGNESPEARNWRQSLFGKESPPKIVFICGGDPILCSNRLQIEQYIKRHSENLVTFRAEYAWETMVELKSSINALALEEWLADFSDVVLILVESFGTAAELGAFSAGMPLRKKLLPILDKHYEPDESFINTGPVRWVNNDSGYGPCIYANFDCILTSMPEVLARIDYKRPKFYTARRDDNTYGDLKLNHKELLFIIILIVTSIGPITESVIEHVCKEAFNIKGKNEIQDIRFIISLTVALEVVDKKSNCGEVYYFCKNHENLKNNKAMHALLRKSQDIRSRCLSHLVYIEEFNKFLSEVA
ncbi:retron St85 family effector protein [Idiomarina abyssalis]|uniref:retron St85 family effector protein n=1 Tax=Idiomarina abyssalis TaxID=86102 RepID=UPI0022FFE909|nr:retron St85 family effector protein [Idiomarina abyssalis]MDA6066697.1 retron St85 family effector protein [Idiomarina abyssalis]